MERGEKMNLKLIDVTEENFFEIINLKSDKLQENTFKYMKDGLVQMLSFLQLAKRLGLLRKLYMIMMF